MYYELRINLSDEERVKVKKLLKLLPFVLDPSDDYEKVIKVGRKFGLSKEACEYLWMKFSGYDILWMLLKDDYIEDISIRANEVVMVRVQGKGWYEVALNGKPLIYNEKEIRSLIFRLSRVAHAQISYSKPVVSAMLPTKDRITMNLGGKIGKPEIVIRKFPRRPWLLHKLIARKTLTPKLAALLWLCNDFKIPVIIYGTIGSGKTSLAGAIIATVNPYSSIRVIQDIPEINLAHPHAHYLTPSTELGIDYNQILAYSLRTSEDYIIFNEVRTKEEAKIFIQAVRLGHGGITTVHADSLSNLLARLSSYEISIDFDCIFINMAKINEQRIVRKCYFNLEEIYDYNDRKVNIEIVMKKIKERTLIDDILLMRKLKAREIFLKELSELYLSKGACDTAEDWISALKRFYELENTLKGGNKSQKFLLEGNYVK